MANVKVYCESNSDQAGVTEYYLCTECAEHHRGYLKTHQPETGFEFDMNALPGDECEDCGEENE